MAVCENKDMAALATIWGLLDLASSPRRAPQPGAGGHQRGVAKLAQLVRQPPRCVVRDHTLPRGPPPLGHARMVPPVAAGEGGPLCGPVDCCGDPPPPRPVYDPAAEHHYEGSGGGTRNTAMAFAKAAVPAAAPPSPPPPPPTSWWILWRPRQPPHTFGQPWRLSKHKERRRV